MSNPVNYLNKWITAPHVLLICLNWQREGSCEDEDLAAEDPETMFI